MDVQPGVLKWAVHRAGWDETTVERKAPDFESWVDGQKKPTFRQIEKFARDTHTPFGLLFLSEPPVDRLPIPDMRTIGNQQIREPSADLLETVLICQRRQDWYRDYAKDRGMGEVQIVGSAAHGSDVLDTAASIRDDLRFGVEQRKSFSGWEEALRHLLDAADQLGVLVMVNGVVGSDSSRKLDVDEFRGFALADPVAPLIFINGADTKAAQIFTVIHELAHIWLGSSAVSDASPSLGSDTGEERWCNCIAAEVLVPLDHLATTYSGTPGDEELERLAKIYRVSTLVVLRRIYDLGGMPFELFQDRYATVYGRLMDILRRKKAKGGGNFYSTQRRRLSPTFASAVFTSTLSGETSFRDGYQLLGVRSHETFMKLGEQSEGH
ncbi:ImmA/IrrE family metallo-endopeptidase [Corynebacterium heidelbergense]|uniref:ImmA/IrrE family metallo-endopeptidase n=1 Tax=Corynebacterium heidelbergense TaxID=2055947 RepID=UPI001EE6F570|nr:ImmA/IrrE family metallo-endopeptidase [Corynebacterium heidelbergense]